MGKQRMKPNYRRRVLRLPDLDHCKLAVLNSLGSPASRRVYEYAIDQFIAWYCSEPRLAFNRIVVVRYRMYLEGRGLAFVSWQQPTLETKRNYDIILTSCWSVTYSFHWCSDRNLEATN